MKFYLLILLIFLLSVHCLETVKKDIKYTNIRNWTEKNGAKFGNFEIKYLQKDNRYVVASEDIKEGDNISVVPEKLMLSESHPLIKPTCEKYNLEDQDCLYVFVCEEMKKDNSFFKPFFDYLPRDYHSYPIFYNKKLKSLLKNTQLYERISYSNQAIRKSYNKLKVNLILILEKRSSV